MGPVHVRMYGRVDLLVNDQRCLVPAGKAIELLVLLAARPGAIVLDGIMTGRLAGTPTVAMENEVHHLISALRRSVHEVDRSLSDDWIQRVQGGYELNRNLVTSDLTEAEALTESDPNDTAVMWWAEPLSDLPPDPFLHVRAGLDAVALRLAHRAMTEYASTLGQVEVERLVELLARHPHEQELWSELADLAVATGDPAALATVKMELQVMQRDRIPVPEGLIDRLDAATTA